MMEKTAQRTSLDSTFADDPLLDIALLRPTASWPWLSNLKRILLLLLCVVYILVSVPALLFFATKHRLQPYSPASHVISYQRQPLYFGEDLKYTGPPEAVDAAWDYLLEPINIRTTEEELKQAHTVFGDDIVKVTDGGYVSVLSVYHELHCLDALRRNIFHDYYYHNATAALIEYNIIHMTHCVDTIRRSLMCKADTAIYTAYWIGDQTALPSKELRSESDTVCVDWQAVDAWSRARLLPKGKYKVRPGPFEKTTQSKPHSA